MCTIHDIPLNIIIFFKNFRKLISKNTKSKQSFPGGTLSPSNKNLTIKMGTAHTRYKTMFSGKKGLINDIIYHIRR